jgi:glycosyltransferase involved in cell wall biosynthesis
MGISEIILTMRLVMTLLVRNEADIIKAHLAYHLRAGVDFVIAADNGSSDGTSEILERHAEAGRLVRLERDGIVSQVDTVTQMARLAAVDHGADWVINADADEFWWPRHRSLKDIFRAVPSAFGAVRGMLRNFVPRPLTDASFVERMTIRTLPEAEVMSPFKSHFKTAHRADPNVRVGGGNHDAAGDRLAPLPDWYPIDILHFPIRSFEQFERKFLRWWEITSRDGVSTNPYYNFIRDEHRRGRLRELYESYVVDDDELRRGLAGGKLVVDTRLREALRDLHSLTFEDAPLDPGYVFELACLAELTPAALVRRRAEEVETRLARLS